MGHAFAIDPEDRGDCAFELMVALGILLIIRLFVQNFLEWLTISAKNKNFGDNQVQHELLELKEKAQQESEKKEKLDSNSPSPAELQFQKNTIRKFSTCDSPWLFP